mmetsp:Transcript_31045/g.65693  ORF Transcript_31045/g.65693 Transcript_31045/m.65693 type:complete len:716 (-) Transcript_31045:888-3035(-)
MITQTKTLHLALVLLSAGEEALAFLAQRRSVGNTVRVQQTATDDVVVTATIDEDGTGTLPSDRLADDVHAVIGSTHINPQPRNLNDIPALKDAFLRGVHPEESQEDLGRGVFVMSDWRKAWYTYGQCDRSMTEDEYERIKREDGFIVDPLTGEAEYDIDDIDGVLPDDLVGVLYRNGAGKFGVNGQRVQHVLDADGLVLRIEFQPPEEVETSSSSSSRVKFTSRFVETEGFREEREAREFTKRGTFGTAPRGLRSVFGEPSRRGLNEDPEEAPLPAKIAANALNVDIKNTANTQVIAFGGKVLALWEAGMPYGLDPISLRTLGTESLGSDAEIPPGKLAVNYVEGIPREFQPDVLGGKAHTAHPHICPRTGRLVGWSWSQNPTDGRTEITITEYDPDGFAVVASETHTLEGIPLAPHDCAVTERYVVLKINALEMDKWPFVSGARGPAECLGMDGRAPAKAFVFPRPASEKEEKGGGDPAAPFLVDDIPACFSIHFSHGYEDEKTGNIVSFFSGWPPNDSESFLGAWGGFCPDYDKIPPTYYWRMEIDPAIRRCVDLRVTPGAENLCLEHPVVHPNFQTKDATFSYGQCGNAVGDASPPLGYARLRLDGSAVVQPNLEMGEINNEVDVYWVGSRRFTGEPLVVPKRNGNLERECDAYLLGLVYDAVRDQSSLMVFDLERELKKGPVCTIWLKTALPHGLHGCFAPDPSVQTSWFC